MCNTLGDRIKARRTELGISQTELAMALGMTGAQKSRISDWENNKRKVPIGEIVRIAQALKIMPEALLGYDGMTTSALVLSGQEVGMINIYRALDKYGKAMIDTALKIEYERCVENSDSHLKPCLPE